MWHAAGLAKDNKKTPLGFKWCSRCNRTLKLEEFSSRLMSRAGKKVEVKQTHCKDCEKINRERYLARKRAGKVPSSTPKRSPSPTDVQS